MVGLIFEQMGDIASGFVGFLVELFQAIVQLFYTAPASESGTGSLTLFGTLTLISAVVALVFWAISLIRSMIRVRK